MAPDPGSDPGVEVDKREDHASHDPEAVDF